MRIFNLFMYQLGVLDRYCDCLLVFFGGGVLLSFTHFVPPHICFPT